MSWSSSSSKRRVWEEKVSGDVEDEVSVGEGGTTISILGIG